MKKIYFTILSLGFLACTNQDEVQFTNNETLQTSSIRTTSTTTDLMSVQLKLETEYKKFTNVQVSLARKIFLLDSLSQSIPEFTSLKTSQYSVPNSINTQYLFDNVDNIYNQLNISHEFRSICDQIISNQISLTQLSSVLNQHPNLTLREKTILTYISQNNDETEPNMWLKRKATFIIQGADKDDAQTILNSTIASPF